jgi:Protein of unknwon function (DUF3310)
VRVLCARMDEVVEPFWVAYGDQQLAAFDRVVVEGIAWAMKALREGNDPLLIWTGIAERTRRVVVTEERGPYELSGVLAAAFVRAAQTEIEWEAMDHDPVNHPRHYTSHPSGIECIQITEHMSFTLGNALKYIWRADLKNGVEDLEKARFYLNREIVRRNIQTPEPPVDGGPA